MRHLGGMKRNLCSTWDRGGLAEEECKERCKVNTGVLCRFRVGRACSGGARSCLEALYIGSAGVDGRDMSMDDRQHGAVDRGALGCTAKTKPDTGQATRTELREREFVEDSNSLGRIN